MKITILNGDMNPPGSKFSSYIEKLADMLQKNHTTAHFQLENMNLHYCTGCWSCWWKTPGQCVLKDRAEDIFKSVISSDFVVFASPLIAGFTSSTLKKITDRLIVLLHPYVTFINGESHHKKRYPKYPDFGLILEREADTDNEDIEIVRAIYDRLAVNFHSNIRYLKFIEKDSIKEIIYETCNH